MKKNKNNKSFSMLMDFPCLYSESKSLKKQQKV